MKQIGLALKQYAMDNKDFYPSGKGAEGLEMLRKGGYLSDSKLFVCPTSGIPPSAGPLREESVSYIYLGSGMTDNGNPDSPLLVERPSDHMSYGNILFVDGHVQGFAGTKWLENAGLKNDAKP